MEVYKEQTYNMIKIQQLGRLLTNLKFAAMLWPCGKRNRKIF